MAGFLERLFGGLRAAADPPARSDKMRELFTRAYVMNAWEDPESRSGPGSTLARTATLRDELPRLIERFGIRSVIDVGCGDFNWFRTLDLDVDYLGLDVVDELIEENRRRYGRPNRRFEVFEITARVPPRADLAFCRDVLVHFENAEIASALRNLRASGTRYLLTTTFTDRSDNPDVPTGSWRPINLERPPFALGPPLALIGEGRTVEEARYADKSMGLWEL